MSKIYNRRKFMKLSASAIPGGAVISGMPAPEKASSGRQAGQKTLRLGFVGVGGRGLYHLNCALGIEGIEVPALCELKPVRLHNAKRAVEKAGLPTPRLYDRGPEDFKRLCENEDLDAIVCCTPWEFHAQVCLSAMRNNKHAVSEVPIVITLDEAWELVETYEKTGKWATLALEGHGELSLLNMIQKGILGDIVHAQTGYIHDLRMVKFTPEEEPWRLQHSLERNGNLYPDHPMSRMLPALDINHGDRIDYLVSMSSSSVMLHDYAVLNYGKDSPAAQAKVMLGDYNATILRTVNGKMITLIHDTSTPHPRENFRIQGTKGVYLSERPGGRIYIEGVSPVPHTWEPAEKYLKENQHPIMINYKPTARRGGRIEGHGGGGTETPFTWHRLVLALRENRMPDWDVYDSVTSSVISPLTEASVANRCKAVDFPDFTKGKWKPQPRITFA